jgi:O-antigen ligase
MKKTLNTIKLVLLGVLFFFLFVKYKFLPGIILLFLIASLFSIDYKNKLRGDYKILVPLIALFFINLVSLFYTLNLKNGFSTIQTQLSLMVFALLIYFDRQFYDQNKNIIKKLFVGVSGLSIIILLTVFVYSGGLKKSIELIGYESFFALLRYFDISSGQHPSYIGLGYLFSVVIIWNSLFKLKLSYKYLFRVLIIGFFITFIFILNSRAVFIGVIFMFVFYSIKYLKEHSLILKISFITLLLLVFIFILNSTRFKSVFQNIEKANSIEEVDLRFTLWRNAIISWQAKPLFGYGIGDSKNAIMDVHRTRHIQEAIEDNLNAHNQFLETLIQTGLVGFIVLVLVFVIPLYQSIKKKQEILFLFLLITFICFFFESMLQRLTGVVFFSFWYSFLLLIYYNDDENKARL